MSFRVVETKNCIKYTKRTYSFDTPIDQRFVNHFSIFGRPEIVEVRKFLPTSNDLVKIRNIEFSFELTGGLESKNLTAIYKLKDNEAIDLVESELSTWLLGE